MAGLVFAFIGGACGSLITWLLYGFNFGSGVSAPFAIWIHRNILDNLFLSQFCADVLIDIVDKIISVSIVFILVNTCRKKWLRYCSFGSIYSLSYNKNYSFVHKLNNSQKKKKHNFSLSTKVMLMITSATLLLGALATTISGIIYQSSMRKNSEMTCLEVTNLMINEIDPNKIDGYLTNGVDDDYNATYAKLE